MILENDSVLSLEDQWDNSKIRNKEISSFYIIDSKGLKSPVYNIKGSNTNYYEVQFETKRVFENEVWEIKNDEITPKGMNGEKQEYTLVKN